MQPATMRAAVTSPSPVRVPPEDRIERSADPASTSATTAGTTGRTTNEVMAQTRAAMAVPSGCGAA
ncbi:hypothetical protein [Motilibacter aurantiacus]|uniref:hypothetical protein n=1 Tax=Motilibacter aurantiacus TaxID=2714955 RepID=UPI00140898D2|nr:hypothetical protein [Motilibacter aurantiacus]NHC44084.1 hypothetical protein [Motilibacter aurantiacus]